MIAHLIVHEGESAKVSGGEQECGAQRKKAANLGMEWNAACGRRGVSS